MNNRDYYGFYVGLIWSVLFIMMVNQCEHHANVEKELRDIEHEIHMLNYK